MRPIRDILKELKSKPLSYWFGWNKPFTYEVANGRVYGITLNHRSEVLVLSEIIQWKRCVHTKSITIYQNDCTQILGDQSNQFGLILERELPEGQIIAVNDQSKSMDNNDTLA